MDLKILDHVKIRPLILTDSELWMTFENQIIVENGLISRKTQRTQEECQRMVKFMLKDIKQGRGLVLVAEYLGNIVGQSSVFPSRQKSDHIGNFGIMITRDLRKIGLGTRLSRAVISITAQKLPQILLLQLGVFAEHKVAIGLYQKLGFQEVARIPNKFQHQNRFMDEIIMHRWVNQEQ